MIFAFLTLLIAVGISAVAAYYSIIGLMAIFAAAKIPIAIMGAVLELGKLIVASWTFRNWKSSPLIMRTYFVIAIVVLMMITSLGIFGFLSRAHLEQANPTTRLEEQLKRIELRLNQKDVQIERLQNSKESIDNAFMKYLELGAVTKGLQSRQDTEAERVELDRQISILEQEKDKLLDEKFEIQNTINAAEVEVGPIRYVASLVYDEVENDQLERAVRWIIILLILVFDPLAVVLIIAGNITLQQEYMKRQRRKRAKEKNRTTTFSMGNKKVIDEGNISEFKDENSPDISMFSWNAFKRLKGDK